MSNFLYIFDKKIQDLYFLFKTINVSKNIVVVEIDEDTLSGRKDSQGNITLEGLGRFPFDRSYYATVIDNLKNAGVSIIALDIIFGEKSTNEADDKLSASIKNAGNVVLGTWTDSSGQIQLPYYKFGDYALLFGYLAPNIDKITNFVYSIKPIDSFLYSEKIYTHFSIAILKGYYSKIYEDPEFINEAVVSTSNKFLIGDKIELLKSRTGRNEVLINYSPSYKFTKYSFLDIYNNKFDKELFKDKIVVIGATAKGIKDLFYTPIGSEYGVYTHVNMINTALSKAGLKYFDNSIERFLIFLLILISVYFNISRSSYVLIFSNISIISIFFFFISYLTIVTNLLFNYSIELVLAIVISLTLSNIVKYMMENRSKTRLNKALSEYVSEDIAKEILSGEGKINLDGEVKNVAIFFSDIEGFTTISEELSPEVLVSFLREYLGKMSSIILNNKGFINKYEGDAIMALWGVFGNNIDSSYNMCLTAVQQQEELKNLNNLWKEKGYGEIKVRIGMHYGDAIIGNIGLEGRKMEFTALGDSVNLASRLEGVNKYYGTYICVSEDVYNIEKNNFEFRYLDKIRVKGKQNSINIYELINFKGKLSKQDEEKYNKFDEAIELYKERKFKDALEIFKELSQKGDIPSSVYKKRCTEYIKNHPDDSWDGVRTMLSK